MQPLPGDPSPSLASCVLGHWAADTFPGWRRHSVEPDTRFQILPRHLVAVPWRLSGPYILLCQRGYFRSPSQGLAEDAALSLVPGKWEVLG